MDYREILSDLVKARIKLDWYLEELKSPSEETKKMEDKFFEELEEVEQEYDEVFQEAKNIVGID
jgi:hypothetical protein